MESKWIKISEKWPEERTIVLAKSELPSPPRLVHFQDGLWMDLITKMWYPKDSFTEWKTDDMYNALISGYHSVQDCQEPSAPKSLKVIDLIYQKCVDIVNQKYHKDECKPTVHISKMYDFDSYKYLLTLVHSNKETDFDSRQSEFIDFESDLYEVIENLYSRTM